MKVKIIKAELPSYWYSGLVGNTYDVIEEVGDNNYIVLGNNGKPIWEYILKSDCVIVLQSPDDYQKLASRTLVSGPDFELTDQEFMALWGAIGLAGEAGEVADSLKKGILHRHGVDVQKLKKELGDVCWYLASICTVYDLSLSDVMQTNVEKLLSRYPNGYNPEDSIKRVDTKG